MSTHAARRRRERARRSALRKADPSQLAHVVPRLAPEVLHQLIQQRGLDACGALVSAATPRQIASVLDLDLWRPAAAGQNDRFDEERFGAWLETLMDEGDTVAARSVAAMDRGVAVLGLSRLVRVFDPAVLSTAGDDGREPVEVDTGSFECEVGGYVVHGKTAHTWDAITGLLVTLAAEHPDDFHALMRGCRRLSNSTPEADGFHDLPHDSEQFVHDVSVERGQRRARQGYLTADAARAFLRLSRQPQSARPDGSPSINAIAAESLRTLDAAVESADTGASPAAHSAESAADSSEPVSIDAVIDLLAEAGLTIEQPRALPVSAVDDTAQLTPLQPLLEYVRDTDHAVYFARSRELAFLSNALLAGCAVQSRDFTIQEARSAAAGVCNLGLEARPASEPSFLIDHDLVTAFEAGWSRLHEEVTVFVTGRLIATLAHLDSVDLAIQHDLQLLRRRLERYRDEGTPWRADLEAIAMLDMPAWACLCGLLGECPVVPAALTAILERYEGPVSATAFEFFSTASQIRKVREFAETLRDVLLR